MFEWNFKGIGTVWKSMIDIRKTINGWTVSSKTQLSFKHQHTMYIIYGSNGAILKTVRALNYDVQMEFEGIQKVQQFTICVWTI